VTIDLVLLNRFNLPSRGPKSFIRTKDGWLQRRVELIQRYTTPSCPARAVSGFRWIIYFGSDRPRWAPDLFKHG
jgi:hypothetical protein